MAPFSVQGVVVGDIQGDIPVVTTIVAPPSAQTQLNILHAPLRTLARHSARHNRLVIDCGGEGQCGPNTLAYLLGLAELGAYDGPELRAAVKRYTGRQSNLERVTNCMRGDGTAYTLGELIIECYSNWPHVSGPLTVDAWRDLIAQPETWTDLAWLHSVADMCKVTIDVTVVNDLSAIWHLGALTPCNDERARRVLEVGMWWNRHLVAIALDPAHAAPNQQGNLSPDDQTARAVATSTDTCMRRERQALFAS